MPSMRKGSGTSPSTPSFCGSGGALPLRFNGGPYLLEKDLRSWDDEYVFQNSREIYWAPFRLGPRGIFPRLLPALRRLPGFHPDPDQAPFQRRRGPLLPRGHVAWGACVAGNSKPIIFRYISSNLEFCLLMEWYYRISGDEAFLRDQAYPIMKEILQFYYLLRQKGRGWQIPRIPRPTPWRSGGT